MNADGTVIHQETAGITVTKNTEVCDKTHTCSKSICRDPEQQQQLFVSLGSTEAADRIQEAAHISVFSSPTLHQPLLKAPDTPADLWTPPR